MNQPETKMFGSQPKPDTSFSFQFSAPKFAPFQNTKQQPNSNFLQFQMETPFFKDKEESICLKVAIEKKKNRVVFLECSNDFVDIIFSFLTLPIGRILRILQGKPNAATIGCMNNLYESVGNLDTKYYSTDACKEMLLLPGTSLGSKWGNLKLKVDEALDTKKSAPVTSSEQYRGLYDDDQNVFIKGRSQLFMLTDDFQVLVGSTSVSITLLKRFGINDPSELEIRSEVVKHDKLVQLLGLSFVSRSPLTHWILPEKDYPGLTKADDDLSSVETSDEHPEKNGSKIMTLVLYIRKSQNSVLYAECGADFIDCIFSFLAFPLGSVLKFLDCNSQLCSLESLYRSVSNLGYIGHLKPEGANLLLCPNLAPFYGSDNQLLHIEEVDLKNAHAVANPKSPTGGCQKGGTYLKGHAKFMVTDDLRISLLSPTGCIIHLAKSNVPITDVDEVSIEFGVKEAKELLKAALTSKTALTDVFRRKRETNVEKRLQRLEGLFVSEVD